MPLLDRFIETFDGKIDCLFWNSMIKRGAIMRSGGYSFYSGWFNIFFPYLDKKWNEFCIPYAMNQKYVSQGFELSRMTFIGEGGNIQHYPSGVAQAPVIWDYNGKLLNMKFLAGFVGYTQDEKTMEICPNLAWCIAHDKKEEENENDQ